MIMIPHEWAHFRAIDYHEVTPWAIVFCSLSPQDELFIWGELNLSPEKNTTLVISKRIADVSEDYRFTINLIDPLAVKLQSNTSKNVIEDLNHYFLQFKREGICTGGLWEGWDTKSTRGRDKVRERLMNASLVKRPFNNEQTKEGIRQRIPTMWVSNTCKCVATSLQKWRMEGDKPGQAHSHFCTALEALHKDIRFKPKFISYDEPKREKHLGYFVTSR